MEKIIYNQEFFEEKTDLENRYKPGKNVEVTEVEEI